MDRRKFMQLLGLSAAVPEVATAAIEKSAGKNYTQIVGAPEDLADEIFDLHPVDTMFSSMCMTAAPSIIHSWRTDHLIPARGDDLDE